MRKSHAVQKCQSAACSTTSPAVLLEHRNNPQFKNICSKLKALHGKEWNTKSWSSSSKTQNRKWPQDWRNTTTPKIKIIKNRGKIIEICWRNTSRFYSEHPQQPLSCSGHVSGMSQLWSQWESSPALPDPSPFARWQLLQTQSSPPSSETGTLSSSHSWKSPAGIRAL